MAFDPLLKEGNQFAIEDLNMKYILNLNVL